MDANMSKAELDPLAIEENCDTDVKKCEFVSEGLHEMYVKKEAEDDLSAVDRSADTYMEMESLSEIKLESVDSSHNLTAELKDGYSLVPDTNRGMKCESEMKLELDDSHYNFTSNVKCEENPVLITCGILEGELEDGFCIEQTETEETNLTETTEEGEVITGRFVQPHCDGDVKIEEHNTWEENSSVEPTQSLLEQKQQDNSADLKCEICGITFTLPLSLEVHRNTHLTEVPSKCKICNKIIAHGYNMRAHELTHSVEKPFKCRFCEKRFAVGKYLKKHELFHKDERPFKCNICLKRFKLLGNVKVHMLTHSEDNRFKCHVCGKEFKDSKTFNDHVLIHTSV